MSDNQDIVRSIDGVAQAIRNPYMLSRSVDVDGWTVFDFGAWKVYEKIFVNSSYAVGGGELDHTFFTSAVPTGTNPSNSDFEIIDMHLWANTSWPGTLVRAMKVDVVSSGSAINVRAHTYNSTGTTQWYNLKYKIRYISA